MLIKVLDDGDASQFFIKSPQQFVQLSLPIGTVHYILLISVVDPHWFQCGSGFSFLTQSGSGSWSDFAVTKCTKASLKRAEVQVCQLIFWSVSFLLATDPIRGSSRPKTIPTYPDPQHCSHALSAGHSDAVPLRCGSQRCRILCRHPPQDQVISLSA
jgi:hypothetical protein